MRSSRLKTCALFAFCLGISAQVAGDELFVAGGSPNSAIYRVDNYATSPTAVLIGFAGQVLNDLAISPVTGLAYGVSSGDAMLASVNLATGNATTIGSLGIGTSQNALEFTADGTLYSWGGNMNLYRIDPPTGTATFVMNLGFSSSGDLADAGAGILYGAAAGANDSLIRINLNDMTVTNIGSFGVNSIFGLDFDSTGTLYATRSGSTSVLYVVDTSTGAASPVGPIAGSQGLAANGISFIPEASTLALLLPCLAWASRRRRSACSMLERAGSRKQKRRPCRPPYRKNLDWSTG
jgi:hypothetical protein